MTKLSVVEPPRPTELRSLANDWLSSVRAGGKSVRTLEAYRWPGYQLFLPFCDQEGIERPDQLDQRVLDRFSASLPGKQRADGRPLSSASIASYAVGPRGPRPSCRRQHKEAARIAKPLGAPAGGQPAGGGRTWAACRPSASRWAWAWLT